MGQPVPLGGSQLAEQKVGSVGSSNPWICMMQMPPKPSQSALLSQNSRQVASVPTLRHSEPALQLLPEQTSPGSSVPSGTQLRVPAAQVHASPLAQPHCGATSL